MPSRSSFPYNRFHGTSAIRSRPRTASSPRTPRAEVQNRRPNSRIAPQSAVDTCHPDPCSSKFVHPLSIHLAPKHPWVPSFCSARSTSNLSVLHPTSFFLFALPAGSVVFCVVDLHSFLRSPYTYIFIILYQTDEGSAVTRYSAAGDIDHCIIELGNRRWSTLNIGDTRGGIEAHTKWGSQKR